MSYGAILGQTPPQPEFKPIASDISYNPSSSQGVISGNNVQSALDQVAGYSKTTRDTANNALNLAKLFDGYEVDGYLEDYQLNQMVSTLNTSIAAKFIIPWGKRPSQSPDFVLFYLGHRSDPARFTKMSPGSTFVIVGDKIKEITKDSEYNAMVIGYEWFSARRKGKEPDFTIAQPLDNVFFKISFSDGFYNQNQQINRVYLESYNVGTDSCSSEAGFSPVSGVLDSDETGQYRYGGFNWDLDNIYLHLHFPIEQYCLVPLNAWAFVKKKTG